MMTRFLPTRPLDRAELRLIPEALWALALARMEVSFRSSAAYLPRARGEESVRPADLPQARRVAAVVEGLARRTPWSSTCLVKSLACYRMLKRRGIESRLHLGVHKHGNPDALGAHAWVSVAGEVLIGGGRLERYSEIARLG